MYEFMYQQIAAQERPVGFYPETSYWVNYDIQVPHRLLSHPWPPATPTSALIQAQPPGAAVVGDRQVPLFLPVYAYQRLRDLRGIAREEVWFVWGARTATLAGATSAGAAINPGWGDRGGETGPARACRRGSGPK